MDLEHASRTAFTQHGGNVIDGWEHMWHRWHVQVTRDLKTPDLPPPVGDDPKPILDAVEADLKKLLKRFTTVKPEEKEDEILDWGAAFQLTDDAVKIIDASNAMIVKIKILIKILVDRHPNPAPQTKLPGTAYNDLLQQTAKPIDFRKKFEEFFKEAKYKEALLKACRERIEREELQIQTENNNYKVMPASVDGYIKNGKYYVPKDPATFMMIRDRDDRYKQLLLMVKEHRESVERRREMVQARHNVIAANVLKVTTSMAALATYLQLVSLQGRIKRLDQGAPLTKRLKREHGQLLATWDQAKFEEASAFFLGAPAPVVDEDPVEDDDPVEATAESIAAAILASTTAAPLTVNVDEDEALMAQMTGHIPSDSSSDDDSQI